MVRHKKSLPTETRALVYVRISGENDDRTASLDTQVDSCLKYARSINAVVDPSDVHREQHSGYFLHSRDILWKVREKLRSGRYAYLIVHAYDRLSRKQVHSAILMDEADRHGAQIHSSTEPYDDSPEGNLIRAIRGYLAEAEREKIRERTMRGIENRIKNGEIPTKGNPRYGYQYNRELRSIEVDEESAEVVRRVYRWIADGYSAPQVASALNEEGVPCYQAKHGFKKKGDSLPIWRQSSIQAMVRCPSYIGERFYWGKQTMSKTPLGKRVTTNNPPEKWTPVGDHRYPQIVSRELWNAANSAMSNLCTRTKQQSSSKRQFMLSGIIWCECGYRRVHATQVGSSGKTYHYYRCLSLHSQEAKEKGHKSICTARQTPMEIADEAVWEEIVAFFSSPSRIEESIRKSVSGHLQHPTHDLESMKRMERMHATNLSTLKSKWRKALEDDEPVFADAVEQQVKMTASKLQKLQVEIELVESEMKSSQVSPELTKKGLMDLMPLAVKESDLETRRMLLLALRARVTSSGKRVTVEINPCVNPTGSPTRRGRNDTRMIVISIKES